MAPPPATPTPHRFLVPRRSQQAKGDETPKAFQLQNSGLQHSQFQATPKFSSLHSTSTPRPSAGSGALLLSSTPATVSRQRNADPINDIDSSPPGSDVDVVLESSPVRVAGDSDDDGSLETRLPKRRRLSLSSFGPPTEDEDGDGQGRDMEVDIQSSLPDDDTTATGDGIEDAAAESPSSFLPTTEEIVSGAHQPTFHRAPRFKPAAEPPEGFWSASSSNRPELRPDAFSPHNRKGSGYTPGGLAASLRDWLVDATSTATSTSDGEEWIARIHVDDVRRGGGMTLVAGRQVNDGQVMDAGAVRIILSGPGRLVGLGRRQENEVSPGRVVGVARPAWEVVLKGLGRWGVVCDWAVVA